MLPAIESWHVAFDWTTDWWDFATPGQELWIYYDGSCQTWEAACSVSASAAAFILIGSQWYFAGAISTSLPFAKDSYDAEHFASAISLKLAYDVLKLHEVMQQGCPQIHFCFDSLTVGSQTSGIWNCFQHPTLGGVLRNLHRLIETRFHSDIYHWHVRGHAGHPGNELVDALAAAAHANPPTSTADWLRALNTKEFLAASDWFSNLQCVVIMWCSRRTGGWYQWTGQAADAATASQ